MMGRSYHAARFSEECRFCDLLQRIAASPYRVGIFKRHGQGRQVVVTLRLMRNLTLVVTGFGLRFEMGTESGEELTTIILRKEWERRLGDGHFWWSVGQSLGANGNSTVQVSPHMLRSLHAFRGTQLRGSKRVF